MWRTSVVSFADLEAAHAFLAPHLDHLLAILDREQDVEAIGAETLEMLALHHPIIAVIAGLAHEEPIPMHAVPSQPVLGHLAVAILPAGDDDHLAAISHRVV